MSNEASANRYLPVEVAVAIRKEAVNQTAKWFIGTLLALAGFALVGWWFYLDPIIRAYIANAAGGVPAGGIIISTKECSAIPGKWTLFKEGSGRFIVGAGTENGGFYSKWDGPGGTKIKLNSYELMQPGGEERHLLSYMELPDLNVEQTELSGHGGHGTKWVSYKAREGQLSMNIIPPYIALYYCLKQ